jgi:hypothetical protein
VPTVVIFLDAEPYEEEFHDIHSEYDEERAALRFPPWEHYPSSGHNRICIYSILNSVFMFSRQTIFLIEYCRFYIADTE